MSVDDWFAYEAMHVPARDASESVVAERRVSAMMRHFLFCNDMSI